MKINGWKNYMASIGLCVITVLFWCQVSMSQDHKVSVSLSGGAGYLPLENWKDFATSVSPSYYKMDKFGQYANLRMSYFLSDKQAIALDIENIKTSASLCAIEIFTNEFGDVVGNGTDVIEWHFTAIPVGLSYEFYPKSTEGCISPFLGAGASYFFSELTAKQSYLYSPYSYLPLPKGTRTGQGYGLHAYLGILSRLTDHLIVVSRLRGRYADGMAFSDKKGAIKVEFTGVDFTLGLGWMF
jgi:outer membrane protein W